MENQLTTVLEAHLLEQKNTILITNEIVIDFFKTNKEITPTQILLDYINSRNTKISIKDNTVTIDSNKFITIKDEYINYIKEINVFLSNCKMASVCLNGNKNIELNNLFVRSSNELNHSCEICNTRFKSLKGLSIHKRKCGKSEKIKKNVILSNNEEDENEEEDESSH
jgi:hypothetical protein